MTVFTRFVLPAEGLVRCHFCSLYFSKERAAKGYHEAWVCPKCKATRKAAGYPSCR